MLVFNAPNTFTAKFHVTKQSADAPSPKYMMLNRDSGSQPDVAAKIVGEVALIGKAGLQCCINGRYTPAVAGEVIQHIELSGSSPTYFASDTPLVKPS